MAGGSTGGPSGWAGSPGVLEGALGRQGAQAAGCQWPQAYKSKRGASGGRGTAGRVGEAGPFLLGKSRRRVSGRDRVVVGSASGASSAAQPGGAQRADVPRSADAAIPLAGTCRPPLGAAGPGLCAHGLAAVLHLGLGTLPSVVHQQVWPRRQGGRARGCGTPPRL